MSIKWAFPPSFFISPLKENICIQKAFKKSSFSHSVGVPSFANELKRQVLNIFCGFSTHIYVAQAPIEMVNLVLLSMLWKIQHVCTLVHILCLQSQDVKKSLIKNFITKFHKFDKAKWLFFDRMRAFFGILVLVIVGVSQSVSLGWVCHRPSLYCRKYVCGINQLCEKPPNRRRQSCPFYCEVSKETVLHFIARCHCFCFLFSLRILQPHLAQLVSVMNIY